MSPAADQPAKLQRTVLDVSSQRVARIYAEALYNAAEKRNEVAAVLGEFDALIDDVLTSHPELETFLLGSAVGRRQKREVLERTFDGRLGETLLNFLCVLNDHDRLSLLRGIHTLLKELADERAGRVPVRVTSAVPLADDQRERLRAELRESFRKEPVLDERLDPDLLGGLVVRVGDWQYDASVRTRLDNIRKQLIERSSHVTNQG